MLRTILLIAVMLFPVSEIALAVFKRANARAASMQDSGSEGFLWVVIAASICMADESIRIDELEVTGERLGD